MTAIRSLADELREKMRQEASGETGNAAVLTDSPEKEKPIQQPVKKKAGKPPPEKGLPSLDVLFEQLTAFELTGNEKLLIRLDNRTVFLLKQLKIAKSIDMNKLIAYSIQAFFEARPELIDYIKTSLQTIEL
jgi:hypothetical protein